MQFAHVWMPMSRTEPSGAYFFLGFWYRLVASPGGYTQVLVPGGTLVQYLKTSLWAPLAKSTSCCCSRYCNSSWYFWPGSLACFLVVLTMTSGVSAWPDLGKPKLHANAVRLEYRCIGWYACNQSNSLYGLAQISYQPNILIFACAGPGEPWPSCLGRVKVHREGNQSGHSWTRPKISFSCVRARDRRHISFAARSPAAAAATSERTFSSLELVTGGKSPLRRPPPRRRSLAQRLTFQSNT